MWARMACRASLRAVASANTGLPTLSQEAGNPSMVVGRGPLVGSVERSHAPKRALSWSNVSGSAEFGPMPSASSSETPVLTVAAIIGSGGSTFAVLVRPAWFGGHSATTFRPAAEPLS